MTCTARRRVAAALVPFVFLAVLAGCSGHYPNSTFTNFTEFNRDLRALWNTMMHWATVVFVVVEVLLIYVIVRYRHRSGAEPKHVHGNTALEITWTLAPAVILVFIAVPTVRTIWRYETPPPADAVQVDVIGHQWWWEFRYPQYGITTANELYLPAGRTVTFSIRTQDVIHSFWIPQLAGKRDATWQKKTNRLWFTLDSAGIAAFNGSCNEFCGASHANMRFRVYTVAPADFESWAQHQRGPAAFGVAPPAGTAAGSGGSATVALATNPAPLPVQGYVFPRESLPDHVIPKTPLPESIRFDDALLASGDPQRGLETYSRSACIGCHRIQGNPMSLGTIGPDLTHIASRHTIAAGLYPNEPRFMARWIKNARAMKPGVLMNTLGKGEFDPVTKAVIEAGGLTDQQIADIVAYLMSLK
ncbi:MAG TPA: cytochrome c oxidase subunit II [Gemmatimonadaceae bacterium]|nr:cytochrome c oxidase subunit II [Gemmatimonadaceae bacterium]